MKESLITASPTFATAKFIQELAHIISSRSIDLVIPAFEGVFYIAKHLRDLSALTSIFCPPLEPLARLHNKRTFTELARELDLPVADTRIVTNTAQLKAAVDEFPEYFARAAFSRGGVTLLTNTGPLAGKVRIGECHPTEEQPWLVQQFLHGKDLCSFSVAHHGKIVAHCTYEHPKTIEHAGGIEFISVDEPQSLDIATRFVEVLGYHGQISFDYMKTDDGLCLIESNPRPTAGVFMMSAEEFCDAIFHPSIDHPTLVKPGVHARMTIAIVRDMFRNPREIPSDLKILLSDEENVYLKHGDCLPALYSLLSYSHVLAFRHRLYAKKHKHSDIMEAQFFDIGWDGGAID